MRIRSGPRREGGEVARQLIGKQRESRRLHGGRQVKHYCNVLGESNILISIGNTIQVLYHNRFSSLDARAVQIFGIHLAMIWHTFIVKIWPPPPTTHVKRMTMLSSYS